GARRLREHGCATAPRGHRHLGAVAARGRGRSATPSLAGTSAADDAGVAGAAARRREPSPVQQV
ncbi:MAG: hypothetical protein AVDCRST_MAG66-771, partial [uncultured Pseudonocardia sp.]